MKNILLISGITILLGLIFYITPESFAFLWGFQILLIPLASGMIMVLVQNEDKSYKFLSKLLIGSLLTSFILSASLQIIECFNYNYGPHCPVPDLLEILPFALLMAAIIIFGGLIGILIRGATLVFKKGKYFF